MATVLVTGGTGTLTLGRQVVARLARLNYRVRVMSRHALPPQAGTLPGIDRDSTPYYRRKLAAEDQIAQSGVPWTILRATLFHAFLDRIAGGNLSVPPAFRRAGLLFQPIDEGEVADRLCERAAAGPAGRVSDIGGPEIHTLPDLARIPLQLLGKDPTTLPPALAYEAADVPGKAYLTTPNNRYGKINWDQWLRRKYGLPTESRSTGSPTATEPVPERSS